MLGGSDDDAIVLLGLQSILHDWGYEVLAAGSTEQALERLRTDTREPDIIVADYRLRGGRVGTEAIVKIRELFDSNIPGVILTGETGPECAEDAAAHGFSIAHKPMALVGFRGDGERAQATSASIKEPSKAFPRLRAL
jgi:CheY-like chemotaxis protein